MADVIPLKQPTPATLAGYRSLLDQLSIDGYSQLIPLEALSALEGEIAAHLKPAHPREVSIAVAALGAWLQIPPSIEDPEQFGKAMEEDLAALGYPADVLNEAIRQARRTLDWYPSIRTMIAICEQLSEPRRREYRAIWQMKAEHARRQQEAAERKAQAEREAQRAAEEEARRQANFRWLRDVEERACERFGSDAPLPGDINLADSISRREVQRAGSRISWVTALDRGEPWAAKFCRLMALAERTRRAAEQGRLDWKECLVNGKLINRDEAAARSAVEKAEARELRLQYACRPPESFWSALWRIHKACGLEVPRSEDPDAVTAALENLKHLTGLAAPELAKMREISSQQLREEWERRPGGLVSPGPTEPATEQEQQ